jgi:hypothetical protein
MSSATFFTGYFCRCEQLREGDSVEALVLSSSPYFDDFQVIRDIYVPALDLWLCDYPFVKRDAFRRLSSEVYWSREREGQDVEQW